LQHTLSKAAILERIPHGADCLLIDHALLHSPDELEAVFSCSGDEYFFKGHYPGNKILPGHIMVEVLGQGGALLAGSQPGLAKPPTGHLVCIEQMRFRQIMHPPFETTIHIQITERRLNMLYMSGSIYNTDKKIIAEGRWAVQLSI
jgi:3-hydroxyacyl-[acyl-carrier-protein] dehydratase